MSELAHTCNHLPWNNSAQNIHFSPGSWINTLPHNWQKGTQKHVKKHIHVRPWYAFVQNPHNKDTEHGKNAFRWVMPHFGTGTPQHLVIFWGLDEEDLFSSPSSQQITLHSPHCSSATSCSPLYCLYSPADTIHRQSKRGLKTMATTSVWSTNKYTNACKIALFTCRFSS